LRQNSVLFQPDVSIMQDSNAIDLPADVIADQVPREAQVQASRLVQEAFAAALRLTAETEGNALEGAMTRLASHLREWSGMSTFEGSQARLALLLSGLDQWGLAYSHAFGAGAMTGLSLLLEDLRGGLDLAAEGACQRVFDQIREDEACALEFKIALRRELHLSLWHSMIGAEDRAQAEALMNLLGGMLLALVKAMPTLGWRLVADALASIQIRCLAHGLAASGQERELTEALFGELNRELPEAARELVNRHSSEAVIAWQQARRSTQH
jgi:hypothetical protein